MLCNCIMANTSAIWQQAAHTTFQLLSPSCSTRAIQKILAFIKTYLRVFWKKVRRIGPLAEKARGLGRKKEEKIGKGNQMTALRIQTGEGHQTFPASLRGRKKDKYRMAVFINTLTWKAWPVWSLFLSNKI